MQRITIVGPGRLGGALALAMSANNYQVETLLYRNRGSAVALARKLRPRPTLTTLKDIGHINSSIILIATQDPDIAAVADGLVNKIGAGSVVFHTSGSQSSDILEPLRRSCCAVASFHPLASISSPESGTERFKDA